MAAEADLPEPFASRTSLSRVPLRLRGQPVTLSGWRMELESPRGKGAIVLADPHYRGEGILLGWDQPRLAALYSALLPPDEPPPQEHLQLG